MTENTPSSVRLDLKVKRDPRPSTPGQIRGGLRVTVDGSRLLAYRDEGRHEFREWAPEYLGDYLSAELVNLFNPLISIRAGETGLYEVEEMRFGGTRQHLALERLSGGNVRLAFRLRPPRDGESDLVPRLHSERGYAVDLDGLTREAIRCGEAFLDAAEEFDHDPDDAPLPTIREYVERMKELTTSV